MTAQTETREFQAHTQKLLELMIHSVYSEKEVFLRELISNASDAIDKVRFMALTDEELAKGNHEYKIRLDVDKEGQTLAISDNGIGMSYDDVVNNLGTIARSGTEEFIKELTEKGSEGVNPELIGRFGLGFYSAFMVADKVVLVTQKHGEDEAVQWSSSGDGTYEVSKLPKGERGTTITLHLKPVEPVDAGDAEEGSTAQDFTDAWALKTVVRKHSDFVQWPVVMDTERSEYPDKEDGEGKDYSAEPKKWMEEEVLNSQQALWTRSKDEITDEEYGEFYKRLSRDWAEPTDRLHLKVEGVMEYTALMYVPGSAPSDLYSREARRGLSLYAKNIFIMEDCRELMPEYLRFIRGLVDSSDIPLNVSREMVQQDRAITSIRKVLTKKWLKVFEDKLKNKREEFEAFWVEFGPVIKEGYHYDPNNKDRLSSIALWRSTQGEGWITLSEYVERMKEGQEEIYVLVGKSIETLREAPQLEVFAKKGVEVLLLTDHVDEFILGTLTEFDGKKTNDVARGDVDLSAVVDGEDAEPSSETKVDDETLAPLCELLKTALEAQISEVRVSARLTDSAACLVSPEEALSPQMEQMMKAMGQEVPTSKRYLEVNPEHVLIQKLSALYSENQEDKRIAEFGELLYAQALLSEGGQLENPARYAKQIAEVMARSL